MLANVSLEGSTVCRCSAAPGRVTKILEIIFIVESLLDNSRPKKHIITSVPLKQSWFNVTKSIKPACWFIDNKKRERRWIHTLHVVHHVSGTSGSLSDWIISVSECWRFISLVVKIIEDRDIQTFSTMHVTELFCLSCVRCVLLELTVKLKNKCERAIEARWYRRSYE